MRTAGNVTHSGGNASIAGIRWRHCDRDTPTRANRIRAMTPLHKIVRRVTIHEYGYGRNRRRLVVALEKGDLITLRKHGCCLTRHTECLEVKLSQLRAGLSGAFPTQQNRPTLSVKKSPSISAQTSLR